MDASPLPRPIARTPDDFTTPASLLSLIWRFGAVTLDPASNPWSDVGACVELSRHRGEDGLTTCWASIVRRHMPSLDAGGFVLVVPPFERTQLDRWAEKIVEESAAGVEILALFPKRPEAPSWRVVWSASRARCDVALPIAFDSGEGARRRAVTLFYAGERPYGFAHVFACLGEPRFRARRAA